VLIGLYDFGTIINHQYSDFLCLLVKGCDSVTRSLICLKSDAV